MICLPLSLFFSLLSLPSIFFFFFFNDTATTEIYTLSLHDALPIYPGDFMFLVQARSFFPERFRRLNLHSAERSEEHTYELQSRSDLVCRLLLEKKKKKIYKARDIEQL